MAEEFAKFLTNDFCLKDLWLVYDLTDFPRKNPFPRAALCLGPMMKKNDAIWSIFCRILLNHGIPQTSIVRGPIASEVFYQHVLPTFFDSHV